MKQEVIQDFLNLPGIVGVALMDKRSRPYFFGVDQTLNFQQKEALVQGILQVFETIPDGFESFKFHFVGNQVYIYKLDHGLILLVLTRNDLVYADYLRTIKSLKAVLREDITNTIATFRLLAGNVTLSSKQLRQPQSAPVQQAVAAPPQGQLTLSQTTPSPVQPAPSSDNRPQAPVAAVASLNAPGSEIGTLNEALLALNHLSQFTTQYLGNHVIANYWKATRPDDDWLQRLQLDRSAQFTLPDTTAQQLQASLTPEQHRIIQVWVAQFIKRCSQVIRDFPNLIQQKALNDAQKKLLLG